MQCGLSTRLIAYVAAGVLATSAAIGVMRVQSERVHLGRLIDGIGQGVATAAASSAAALIAGYDYGNLEILTRNIAGQDNVERVVIRNRDGRAMSEASASHTGAFKRFDAPVRFNGQQIGSVAVDMSTDVLERALDALYWRVFVEQLVFGLVLGVIVYFFTARGIVSPIRRLTSTMEEALEKGRGYIARDLEVTSADEIGRLVSVFNTLNRSLARYQGQLQGKIEFADQELREKNIQLGARTRELEHALDLLNTMATTDWLTELPNRRKFDESMSRMFHQSERFAEDITLVLFDIDHFKQINDSHGHSAGDEVLRDIGILLRLHVRKTDLPARLGGDEFGIVLYHTTAAQATLFVEKFLNDVRAYDFSYQGRPLTVRLSVGLAQYDSAMNEPQALYYAADKALYRAKQQGRDGYCTHGEADRQREVGT